MIASRNIDDLDPRVAQLCQDWISACKRAGIDVIVTSTYRDIESQDALYAVGRTVRGQDCSILRPMGRKVTNAKGGESYHNYRVAFDFVPLENGKPAWNNTGLFEQCGHIGEMLGLEWAGRWSSFCELAHLQQTFGLTIKDLQAGKRP